MRGKGLGAAIVVLASLSASNAQDDICGYAPLCGTGNTVFDWTTEVIPDGTDGTSILGAELSFVDCCKLADTQPTEQCQIVDPTGESYRTMTASAPICGSGGEDCEEGSCNEYQLVINPTFVSDSQNDGCCDSCTCYGDPQCVSFSGEYKMWVLCDGREVPWDDSIWEMCRITERTCLKQKDHAGNKCVYLAEDSKGRDWTVGKQGSPCQPNPNSGASTITMYSVPSANFVFTLEQGDRGIIQKAYLSINSGEFVLDAEKCLNDGKNAWTYSSDIDELPAYFSYNDVVFGKDQHWSVVDPNSGISISIRCHGNHYDGDDTVYVPRMNIEDLSDPVARGSSNSGGFCVTGDFDYGGATTSNTKKIIDGGLCDEGLQDSDEREVYRALCHNPGLPASGQESCLYFFCNEHYLPLYSSIEECQETFSTSLAEGFCRAIVYTENDVAKCLAQWFDLGAVETITQYYDDASGCTSQTQTTLTECQSGVIIQYFRSGQWNDQIAIPTDFCSSEPIVLSYCDYPYLFNRQIRILQKTAAIKCGPVNQCQSVEGFRAIVGLVKDTPYPTQFPTIEPTAAPTSYPTPYPVAPTPYPTPYPDPPTVAPTPFPSEGAEPTPCPISPLCETENQYIDFEPDSDEFHIEMDYCCPVQQCPTDQPETQTRYQGTREWWCGLSDGANGTVADSITAMECEDQFELTIQIMFSHEEDCCKKCTCFGDPRCYSFDGTFEEFILCDGRTAAATNDERCIIRKSTCEAQLDHEGNACAWENPYKSPPDYSNAEKQAYEETKYSVSSYGSPCRYDTSVSEAPIILLYQVPGQYMLEVEQGERGFIQSVTLTKGSDIFHITADSCLDGDDWEIISGSDDDIKWARSTYGKEYVWHVEDTETGIILRIRCTGHLEGNKYTGPTFINVEALLESDDERIESAEGFCATNQMTEKALASTSYSDSLAESNACEAWNQGWTDIMQRDVARIITNNPGVTLIGTESAYRSFCNQFFMPYWSSVGKCVDAFMTAKNVKTVIKDFCNAVTKETDACIENLELLAESDSYKAAFTEGYEQYVSNYDLQCEVKFSDLPTSLTQNANDCQTGAELQFFNPRKGAWITYAAFPDDAPCAGYTVKVLHDNHPKLFKNPIRLVQTHNFEYCNKCTHVSSVMGWFTYSQESSDSQ